MIVPIAQTDHVKRTFDYEPFIKEFITCLHNEGLLEASLDGGAKEDTDVKTPKKRRKKS